MRSVLFAFCAAVLAFAPVAQAGPNDGYLIDKDGKIVKGGSGMCVRSTRWKEASADRDCLEKWKGTRMATRK